MTDIALLTNDSLLDIDIVNGEPVYLSSEDNNTEQRAAIASYTVLGTIPAMLSTGVDWASYFNKDKDIVKIDNQIQQNIRNLVNTTDQYLPLYMMNDGNIQLVLMRGNE